MIIKFFLKNLHIIFLTVFIVVSQVIILKPHLRYGFSDVDWGFLSIYKTQNPYTLSQFIENIKVGGTTGGVYTHQIYYIGIQNDLFGLDFKSFQITTHVFKILATLAVFPLLLAISGSRLVALIATILFGFSYSAVGTMYTVVTSNDYLAIFSMGLFFLSYWYVIKKNTGNWFLLFITLLLLVFTLFLSTERMYPLPLFIGLTELFLLWTKKSSSRKNTIKRISVVLLPLSLIFLAQPLIFLDFISRNGSELLQRIIAGNWNLILTPFVALGSIIVPHNYTEFLGVAKMDSFGSFLDFLITGPLFILVVTTLAIGTFVFKKPHIIILQIFGLMILFSILLYILGSHFVDHQISIEAIVQALIGFYIFAFSIVSFIYWLKYKNRLLIGLFVGPIFALLYIFLTWLGAATSEVFSGAHRYLTIPSMGISIFIATLAVIIFQELLHLFKNFRYLKIISIIPFILLLIFIRVNVGEIKDFFNYQLYNGFGAQDKQFMRSQLNSYLTNLSSDKPSLLYFDFTQDNLNGYYYDNTLLGGFGTWILWHKNINFKKELTPTVFWNNPELLKASIKVEDGEKLIIYDKKVYDINNFYAFKLKDKKVIDIKSEILNQLGVY